MTRFRAYVADDYADPLQRVSRLFVVEDVLGLKPSAYLGSDGLWHQYEGPEGVQPALEAGIALPREAFPVIGEAILRWSGGLSDAATEAKVLREWLTVEKGRVDEALKR